MVTTSASTPEVSFNFRVGPSVNKLHTKARTTWEWDTTRVLYNDTAIIYRTLWIPARTWRYIPGVHTRRYAYCASTGVVHSSRDGKPAANHVLRYTATTYSPFVDVNTYLWVTCMVLRVATLPVPCHPVPTCYRISTNDRSVKRLPRVVSRNARWTTTKDNGFDGYLCRWDWTNRDGFPLEFARRWSEVIVTIREGSRRNEENYEGNVNLRGRTSCCFRISRGENDIFIQSIGMRVILHTSLIIHARPEDSRCSIGTSNHLALVATYG